MDHYVTYVTGTEDIRAGTVFLTRRGSVLRRAAGRGRRRMLLGVSGFIIIVLVILIAANPPPPNSRPQHTGSAAALLLPLAFVAVFLGLAIGLARLWKGVYWRYIKKHGGLDDRLGPTELELTDEGVHADYRMMRLVHKWDGVT